MDAVSVLADMLTRPFEVCRRVLAGICTEDLNAHLVPGTNSTAWLLWHTGREADVQLAALTSAPEVWTEQSFHARLGLPAEGFGFGQSADEAAGIRIDDPEALGEYLAAVENEMAAYLRGLAPADLDDVIDRYDGQPVTRGVRLVSIIDDAAQHAGQAAFIRGARGWDAPRP
ncbi:DUF664 domain-containing protein [Brevibacterium luteolum]|uniref:DUF664 domain-containing protein n=1 Tax=Brevibacterium luteolum TaxID=199591 RepID=A0A849ATD5_9MICO|nr:DUF664 domain-containing protein [Brevibacterium luteolum]MBM7530292.1 hypothetical protein [Brevibacterium luteolum]NNG80079.1 DUF664 domain-containing protein [Brevibacterium luteolum]